MKATRRALLAAAASLAGLGAHAQPAPRRIAHLGGGSAASEGPLREVFGAAMNELGWHHGRNIVVDSRFAEGDAARVPALIAELLASTSSDCRLSGWNG